MAGDDGAHARLPSYRSSARILAGGWDHLTERAPGYPLVLLLTGSSRHETHLLFAVQIAMHLASILLVVAVARRLGVPRTSAYVERLPASYEPARSILVGARDRALLDHSGTPDENFIWTQRQALADATGKRGTDLDHYVLQIDLELISHHPFEYLDQVIADSTTRYPALDSQPVLSDAGRAPAWALDGLHLVLLAAFLLAALAVPGLVLAGLVDRRTVAVGGLAVLLCGYGWASSVLLEIGTARYRAPTEPMLALLVVTAWWVVGRARRDRLDAPPG